MIHVLGSPKRLCNGVTRRDLLTAGSLGAIGGLSLGGLSLENALRAEANPAPRPGKAKSVIMLYLLGGAPTQDMWDLKPDAPAEVRGEFKPIETSAAGIKISEMLPLSAKWMHRSAIVRSVTHQAGCHNTLPSYTGYEGTLDNIVSTKESYPPSMGSVCEYLGMGPGELPAYVYMPCYLGWGQNIRRPGPYAGFLGQRYDPFYTECAPYVDKPPETPYYGQPLRGVPKIPHGSLEDGLTVDRFGSRKRLLEQLDESLRQGDARPTTSYDRHKQKAMDLILSAQARAAFDVEQEPTELREKYTPTLFGQSALIARRLVEAGVRFVNVTWDCYWERLQLQYACWDTHARNFPVLRELNLPYLDATYSALMQDLEDRGLLDETLVVTMTDFGRTPRINGNGGRDHWTFCYSLMFSGAGVRGGTIHGASDAQAAYVKDSPVSTADICCTIYELLGIDPQTAVPDKSGRPVFISHGGQPIRSILA